MKIILPTILLLFSFNAFSQQQRVEGNLDIDSTDAAFGQFMIYNASDSTLVKGSYIDSTFFSLEFESKGMTEFYVKIRLAGYIDTLINFSVSSETISFGTLKMISERSLGAVDIVFVKPEFQRTMDGIRINVQGTTLQTLSTLYDVLIASPKITSPDGQRIEIIGKGSPVILVDRQPIISNDELKAIPANMVESIEIITNPSAKYKGQGGGNGVIEVFTKNFALEGYTMNISASGGMSTQLKPVSTLNLGLSIKRKKFSMSSYLGANYDQDNALGTTTGITSDDSDRSLYGDYSNQNWNTWMYYQLKASYQINPTHKITSGIRGNTSFGGSEATSATNYNTGSVLETSFNTFADPSYSWMQNSAFLNYIWETDTNKSNFNVNLNLIQKSSGNSGSSRSTFQNISSGIFSDFNIKTESRDRPLVGELRINYDHVFDTTGWEFSTGLSYSELRNAKIYNQYNLANDDWVIDSAFTNSYDYKEHIGTVYAELSKNWKKMGFRIGVTGEFTGLDGYSNSLQKQFIDSVYFRPFPSASILVQPTENISMTLGYSSGIDRPQFSNYDPFVRIADSLSISYGNPYLRPSISHSLRLETDLFYAYNISIYVSDTKDPVSEFSFVDDSTFLTNTTSWNALRNQSIGADISIPLQLKWLQGWNSFWISYDKYSFTPEFKREPFSNLTYGIYSYLTFILPKDFSIMNQVHLMRWGDSQSLSNTQFNWGLRLTKKYKNNDFQIYFDVANIIPPKSTYTMFYGNYTYTDAARYQFTTFKIGLFYKFGRLKQAANIQESNSGQSDRL